MASGNILVDDSDSNLTDWSVSDGISFNFGKRESQFPKVDSLEDVLNPDKAKVLLKRFNK